MPALAQSRERLRSPTFEKPLGPFGIDWAHKLAPDLAFYVVADGGVVYDAVSGVNFPLQAGSSPGATPLGDGIAFDGTAEAIENGPSGFQPLRTSTGDGQGSFTLLLIGSFIATATGQEAASVVSNSGSNGCVFLPNFTSNFGSSSGRMALDAYTSADNTVSIAGAVDGTVHAYAAVVVPAARPKLYLDGALPTQQTTGGTINSINLTGSTSGFIGICDNDGFNPNARGTHFAFAGFNRALDPVEILDISLDPYSLLSMQEGELPALFFMGGAPPPSGVSFRRTRSHLGTRINSRQVA
jgi:hypothetical protein